MGQLYAPATQRGRRVACAVAFIAVVFHCADSNRSEATFSQCQISARPAYSVRVYAGVPGIDGSAPGGVDAATDTPGITPVDPSYACGPADAAEHARPRAVSRHLEVTPVPGNRPPVLVVRRARLPPRRANVLRHRER